MAKTQTTPTLHSIGAFDSANLHIEIENLAGSYGSECDGLLEAVNSLNHAKQERDSVEANLDLQIRKTAEISGEKTTEKKIKSAVEATDTWGKANAAVDSADLVVERQKLALRTLDKKERMVELIARFQIKEMGAIARTT